ncbi:hypothetical protein PVL30_002915 [Lodderomyces elongisporus]|uniref:uncharacterized protein n=1 Tax=Lodderomyces elongisporus TaxID=36914 RepID=UPI00291E465F|nr:uncharacterized protein PVL30_002915 [Lodderomyces elongisporus]WLF79164.1 hypothetical protein PVL30_002915 [Lodderomyces elongisporus]
MRESGSQRNLESTSVGGTDANRNQSKRTVLPSIRQLTETTTEQYRQHRQQQHQHQHQQQSQQQPLPNDIQLNAYSQSQQRQRQLDFQHENYRNAVTSAPGSLASQKNSELNRSSMIKQRLPKRFFCKTCNQGFTRKHNMVSHELIHSSSKPHICTVCNLKFRRIHDLKRHEKLHTGERPYSCDRCSKTFARPDALTRHQNSANACTRSDRATSFIAGDNDDNDNDDNNNNNNNDDDDNDHDDASGTVSSSDNASLFSGNASASKTRKSGKGGRSQSTSISTGSSNHFDSEYKVPPFKPFGVPVEKLRSNATSSMVADNSNSIISNRLPAISVVHNAASTAMSGDYPILPHPFQPFAERDSDDQPNRHTPFARSRLPLLPMRNASDNLNGERITQVFPQPIANQYQRITSAPPYAATMHDSHQMVPTYSQPTKCIAGPGQGVRLVRTTASELQLGSNPCFDSVQAQLHAGHPTSQTTNSVPYSQHQHHHQHHQHHQQVQQLQQVQQQQPIQQQQVQIPLEPQHKGHAPTGNILHPTADHHFVQGPTTLQHRSHVDNIPNQHVHFEMQKNGVSSTNSNTKSGNVMGSNEGHFPVQERFISLSEYQNLVQYTHSLESDLTRLHSQLAKLKDGRKEDMSKRT